MISDEVRGLLGSDPNLTKLQLMLLLGILLLYGIWAHWNEMAEPFMYVLFALPLGVLLIRKSNQILIEIRIISHRRLAQLGVIIGFLLLIPKWLFYVWFGWQIGLFG